MPKKKKKKKTFAEWLKSLGPGKATNKNADKLLKEMDNETMSEGAPVMDNYDQSATRKRRYTGRM